MPIGQVHTCGACATGSIAASSIAARAALRLQLLPCWGVMALQACDPSQEDPRGNQEAHTVHEAHLIAERRAAKSYPATSHLLTQPLLTYLQDVQMHDQSFRVV